MFRPIHGWRFSLNMIKPLKGLFYRDWGNDHIVDVIKETWMENIYEPYIKKDMVTVEIGAKIGIFTMWAYQYSSKILAVEPSAEHFDTLMHMLTFNNMLDKVIPINKAISNENGKAKFYHNGNTTSYSLSDSVQANDDTEEVEMIGLEELLKDTPHVDLLNLDIEGFESRVLADSQFDTVAPKIDTIVVEHHLWSGVTVSQLQAMLSDRGFKVNQEKTLATVLVGIK